MPAKCIPDLHSEVIRFLIIILLTTFSPMSTNLTSASPDLPTATTEAEDVPLPSRVSAGKIVLALIGAIILVVAVFYGVKHLRYALAHAETDDAQVEGDISPVLPRVSGYVTRVLVRDNERVAAGQPLIEIDARELDLKVSSAAAALKSALAAQATSSAARANAQAAQAVAAANESVAGITEAKAASDLKRDTALFATNAITDRQMTDTQAAADVSRAQHQAVRRQAQAAAAAVDVTVAELDATQSQIEARRADLAYAQLQQSYATVTAPIAGEISHKSVEPGQFVQAGQTLLWVASDADVWVVANFKETQLPKMQVGQPVEFKVDGFPGLVFHGRVESIAAATGARFALLPPDNASGNYVKVTQRVPVKIVLTDAPDLGHVLRPGLSVTAAVLVNP
jgi:membrane fusion protein (multidrug efflux system)